MTNEESEIVRNRRMRTGSERRGEDRAVVAGDSILTELYGRVKSRMRRVVDLEEGTVKI